MWRSYLHLVAKQHLILFKYDKVIKILARQPSDFLAMKKVVDKEAKFDAAHHVGRLLPKLFEAASRRICLPSKTERQRIRYAFTQECFQFNCPEFIRDDQWPPISPYLNTMDYHVWSAMLEAYHKLHPKPKYHWTQVIWVSLPQEPINKAVKSFTLWLERCTKANGEQFENTKWLSNSNIRHSVHCIVSVTLFCCV